MKSAEEKADKTLESLEGISRAEFPSGLEEKMFARFDAELRRNNKTVGKWFWVAASVLLLVNVAAGWRYVHGSNTGEVTTTTSTQNGESLFSGGSSWY